MYNVIEYNYSTGTTQIIATFNTEAEAKNHCEICNFGYDHSKFWTEEATTEINNAPQYTDDDLPF